MAPNHNPQGYNQYTGKNPEKAEIKASGKNREEHENQNARDKKEREEERMHQNSDRNRR